MNIQVYMMRVYDLKLDLNESRKVDIRIERSCDSGFQYLRILVETLFEKCLKRKKEGKLCSFKPVSSASNSYLSLVIFMVVT